MGMRDQRQQHVEEESGAISGEIFRAGKQVEAKPVKELEGMKMGKKTVGFNKSGISKLPDDKPVVYKIKGEGGKTNYVGTAQRGRVQERLEEHLSGGKDALPGTKVEIEQMKSISEARQKETNIISKTDPKYNKKSAR